MDDIIIKYGQCIITIYAYARITDIRVGDLRKLLKLAKAGFNNDPAQIKREMLLHLDHEAGTLHNESLRTDYFRMSDKEIERQQKKIEKYRKVVEEWDI